MRKLAPLLMMLTTAALPDAVSAADKALLDVLLGNGAITRQQYAQLLAREELTVEDVEDIRVNLDSDGLNVAGEDFEVTLGGRLHQDHAVHDHDSRMGEHPVNGSQLRRGRIELDGRLFGSWGWAAEVDFQDNDVSVKDFKVGYVGEGGFSLYVGNQKQPYSHSLEMSSNDIPFIERSIDNYLVSPFSDRAMGVRVEDSGEHWFFAGGVFGDEVAPGGAGDEGWGPSARIVFAPLIEDEAVVHLGLRGQTRRTDASRTIRVRDETKEDLSGLRIVDTGELTEVDKVSLFGPELAVAWGPLSLFGEYNDARVDREGQEDLRFTSWHLGGAWSLTGESRARGYRIDAGEFKGLAPDRNFGLAGGGLGAWELVARYAAIDLNDGGFTGGSEEAVNGGLNWYPNRNVRFMFDWTHVVETDESNAVRLYAPGMDIFSLRAHYAW